MRAFKKILFPVDLSETSPRIVPYAKNMAETFEAELHVLFVARVLEYFTSIYVPHPSVDRFEAELLEGAQKRLREFKEEYFESFPSVKTVVKSGEISEEIIAYIESEGIDLVILGTHGRKGLDKIVFGSVAERVSKNSPVPVLLINPHKLSDSSNV